MWPLCRVRGLFLEKGGSCTLRTNLAFPSKSSQGSAPSFKGSAASMALDVERSPSEASLSGKPKHYGGWNYADVETDYPELVNGVRRRLDAEEVRSSPKGTERMAMSGRGRLVSGVTQRDSSYCREAPLPSASRLSGAKANYMERQPFVSRTTPGSDLSRHVSHRFLSSEEQQQMKMGCSEPASSAPNLQSSAEETGISDFCHDISTSQWSHRSLSPFSSTLGSLPNKTTLSPENTLRSHSRSSFSTLSLEENSICKQQEMKRSQSLAAGVDVPPAAITSWDLRHQSSPTEDRLLRARKPLSPLLDDCVTMERVRKMSSFQADYWACAIPDSLPPSPDRQSPHWDPNKEYEDLLDYAYPLKPRYKLGKTPEPFLHDSGIDVDSFSVSPEGTLTSASMRGQGRQAQGSRENLHKEFAVSAERFSTPVSRKPGCLGSASYYEPSPIAKASFAKSASSAGKAGVSRGFAKGLMMESAGPRSLDHPDVAGRSWCTRETSFSKYNGKEKSAHRFLPTVQMLPLRKEWEGDEEFLSLPPRLRELESLAQYLSDLSLTVRTPGQDRQSLPCYGDSKEPLSSESVAFGEAGSEGSEDCGGLCQSYSSREPSGETTELCRQHCSDPPRRPDLPASIGAALDGSYLNELQVRGSPEEKGRHSESLAQCIKQMFCCQLEELIRWLYKVAEVADKWVPPAPGVWSVKASVHRYLEFKKDVADHRGLTESVLHRGEALLQCMASNSPALKDTLDLIAKQSEELENHMAHWYKSVLAAVEPLQGEDVIKDVSVRQTPAQAKEAKWAMPLADMGFVSQSLDG
ncbi:centrosomal protein of 68 kDa isoform X4 [Apteryx rowi]|uniref:centrosomal protein of 68 kDa isoform X4 n=1 Tax=Apteryx rowi TaxID=308060 RepID=UPI000E1D9421|nr:centrosomal protein of 68 kDa isoform X4 [Apteryx rowi]